jgi:uncharacterized radical SAM superfamily protein
MNRHINENRSSVQNINLIGIASPFGESRLTIEDNAIEKGVPMSL